jgi:hypothetical protein
VRTHDVSPRSSLCFEKKGDSSTVVKDEKKIECELRGDRLGLGPDRREIKEEEEEEEDDEEEIAQFVTPDSSRPGLFTTQTNAKSLRSIKSHHSRAGADGYTLNHEDEKPNNSSEENASDDPYLVRWEGGDADPMNPRSMTTLRRWCIVLIVSASSLCV